MYIQQVTWVISLSKVVRIEGLFFDKSGGFVRLFSYELNALLFFIATYDL